LHDFVPFAVRVNGVNLIVVLVGGLGWRGVMGFRLGVVVLICETGICFNYDAFRAQILGI